jgi:predicted RNA-binding protein YlqC (UPF0109 family)
MSNTIDQQFVEYVVKSLVGNPDAVSVARSVDDKGVLLELTVDPEDLGRVIGKRGATAQSLRTLLRALGTKNEARYNLKIVDNGVGAPAKPSNDSTDDSTVAPVIATQAVTEQSEEDDEATEPENDVVAKTRAELDELDDLDI